MKSTIKAVIITALGLFASATIFAQTNVQGEHGQVIEGNQYPSQSVLKLVNNTDLTAYASFVYFDPIDQCWISRGWRTIKPHESNRITFGAYEGNVYIHGYEPDGKMKWGKGYSFATEEKFGYRLLHADGDNCTKTDGTPFTGKNMNYTQVPIHVGENVFEFNP